MRSRTSSRRDDIHLNRVDISISFMNEDLRNNFLKKMSINFICCVYLDYSRRLQKGFHRFEQSTADLFVEIDS